VTTGFIGASEEKLWTETVWNNNNILHRMQELKDLCEV